jgi:hypothetical protein
MSGPIDRAALERAINALNQYFMGNSKVCTDLELAQIGAAARAHFDTLPKTKTVAFWHVEYVVPQESGDLKLFVHAAFTEEDARRYAGGINRNFLCVHVTGPHQHEVPA